MNVVNVAFRIKDICDLWGEICNTTISPKVATLREQIEMKERINAVIDRYNTAKENGDKYIPAIRKELNQIEFILKRWLEYNEIVFSKAFDKLRKIFK